MKWLTECRQRNRYMEAYKKGEFPKEEITALLDNEEMSADTMIKIYSLLLIGYPNIFSSKEMKSSLTADITRRTQNALQKITKSVGTEQEEHVDVSSTAPTLVQGNLNSSDDRLYRGDRNFTKANY